MPDFSKMTDDTTARDGEAGRCPICGKPPARDYRPFCSKRCADIDLGRWLNGVYAVPDAGQDEGLHEGLDDGLDEGVNARPGDRGA